MHKNRVAAFMVFIFFCAVSVYGAENESLWQRLRNRFSQPKETTKSAVGVTKPAPAAAQPVKEPVKPIPQAAEAAGKSDIMKGAIIDKGVPVSQEIPVGKEDEAVARKARKDMTTEELIADIKDSVEGEEEILNFIPSLKRSKGADGKNVYMFNEVKIEDLKREDLEKLSINVGQVSTRLHTERIQNQLETIRQVQALGGGGGGGARGAGSPPGAPPTVRTPALPPAPPAVMGPPKTVQTPQTPNLPRVPSAPAAPAAPSRR